MGDSLKIWKVVTLFIAVSLLSIPVALAEEEQEIRTENIDSASVEKDYIVSPVIEDPLEDSSNTDNYVSTLSTQYIIQGQTITHKVNIGSGVDYLEVDLNWGDISDSLTLKVYTPSGSKIGTYSDSSDGSVNGRIHLNINPSQGYIQQGTWKFKVFGESVSGTESYTFNVYSH